MKFFGQRGSNIIGKLGTSELKETMIVSHSVIAYVFFLKMIVESKIILSERC